MIKLLSTLLLLASSLFASLSLYGQSVYSRHYTTTDGLPHNIVYSMMQDSEGFIWFCTDDGMAKFDGRNMKVYQQEQGLNSNFTIYLAEKNSDEKYIATWKGGVHLMKNDSIHPIKFNNYLAQNSSYIDFQGDSVMYIVQGYILMVGKKNKGQWTSKAYWPYVKGEHLLMGSAKQQKQLIANGYKFFRPFKTKYIQGQIYIYGVPGGLYTWDGSSTKLVKQHQSLIKNRRVNSIECDSYGNKWIGFKGKILKIAGNGTYTWYSKNFPDQIINKIFTSKFGDQSKIAFNTSHDGVAEDKMFLFTPKTGTLSDLKKELGFLSGASDFCFDKDGNYWVTTIGDGVYWVLNRPYDYYDFKDVATKFVYDIEQKDDNNYWISTKSGVYTVNHAQRKIEAYSHDKIVRFIFVHPNNKLPLYGTRDGTTLGTKKISTRIIRTKPVLLANQHIYAYSSNSIFRVDPESHEFTDLLSLKLARYKRTRSLLADSMKIWAATEDGVLELEIMGVDSIRLVNRYDESDGLPSLLCYDIKKCKEGKIWVATERGVATLEGKKFQKVAHLPAIRCIKLLHDHRNKAWIATTNGLFYYNGKEYIPFNEETGLLANDVNGLFEDKNHQIWVGSSKGLTILDNTDFPSLSEPPVLNFIPPKQKKYANSEQIRIDFSAINFESPKSTVYRYKLNNQPWQTTTNPFVEYNALTPNHYTFEVQAKKFNSRWGPSHAFSFETIAPWYFRWWAIALEVSFFILIVIWIARKQINQAYAVSRRLRSEIHQRITMENQLAEVRNQIARDFHDEMGNKLASITVLSNLISFKLKNPDQDIADLLIKIEESSKQLYRGTKDFIWSIDTKSDNVLELFTYLRDFGESFYQPLEIDFYVETTGIEYFENSQLPLHWSRQIVLIFKEAMTNVAKYAQCKSVWFQFSLENNLLEMSLKDNGVGFDISSAKKGNGLKNMKERAAKIRCSLELSSSEEGTVVAFQGKLATMRGQRVKPTQIGGEL